MSKSVIQFPAQIQFLHMPDVMSRVGVSRAQINRLRSSGEFPQPVSIGKAGVRWVAHEIDAWMQARMAARGAQEPATASQAA
jgi:prophage regulatory protein